MYVCIYIYIYMYVCMHVCMYMYIYIYIYIYTYTHLYLYTHIYMCTFTHTYAMLGSLLGEAHAFVACALCPSSVVSLRALLINTQIARNQGKPKRGQTSEQHVPLSNLARSHP